MRIHELGKAGNSVILLLPGTMCFWRGNFGSVIDELAQDFLVAVVAYTGFDEADDESCVSVMDEVKRIETYIQEHYDGAIREAYGCSLGGTFVAHLAARHNVHMRCGVIGSAQNCAREGARAGGNGPLSLLSIGEMQRRGLGSRFPPAGREKSP